MRDAARHREEVWVRFKGENFPDVRTIEGQVQAGTAAYLQDATFRSADHALAIGMQALVAHEKIAELRQDDIAVNAETRGSSRVTLGV